MGQIKFHTSGDTASVLGGKDPLRLMQSWLRRAQRESGLKDPWAMSLSTCRASIPSSRMVLLKTVRRRRLIFYSNYISRKGGELEENPQASALFYWESLGRQLRIEGAVQKISRKQSTAYWNQRDPESCLSQSISLQSRSVLDRSALEALRERAKDRLHGKRAFCPPSWGGYALSPLSVEFWQSRAYRLHDRFLFQKKGDVWSGRRLFP